MFTRTRLSLPLAFMIISSLLAAPLLAAPQEPHDDHDAHAGHSHDDPLHFAHPLVTESPLPENEARLEFSFANLTGEDGEEFSLNASIEFAPVRWFSIELAAPVTHLNPDTAPSETRLGDISLGFKFATFAFENHGLLLSAGFEFILPTGNEERSIGNDHILELEPWLGLGFKRDRFEFIARLAVGIPTNTNGDDEADAEVEWGTSLLIHLIDDKLAALLELDGSHAFGGEEDGFNALAITPGLRLSPFENPDLTLGLGLRLPLTTDRDSHVQMIFTMFFHF